MNIIYMVICLLVTFSVMNIAFSMQQSEIMDLQKKLETLGYYACEINGKLDEATMEAVKECQKVCILQEICVVDKETCMMVDKALKEQESIKATDISFKRLLCLLGLLKQGCFGGKK